MSFERLEKGRDGCGGIVNFLLQRWEEVVMLFVEDMCLYTGDSAPVLDPRARCISIFSFTTPRIFNFLYKYTFYFNGSVG